MEETAPTPARSQGRSPRAVTVELELMWQRVGAGKHLGLGHGMCRSLEVGGNRESRNQKVGSVKEEQVGRWLCRWNRRTLSWRVMENREG